MSIDKFRPKIILYTVAAAETQKSRIDGGHFFLLTNIQGCSLGCRQNFLSNTKEYIFKLLQKIVNKLHSIYVKNI